MRALEAKIDSLVVESLTLRGENVNLKEPVDNLYRNTTIQRENTEKSDLIIKGFKKKGGRNQDWQRESNQSKKSARKVAVIKVQETVKQIENNLLGSQSQMMEEAKKITAAYADVSKVNETVNEKGKMLEKTSRSQGKK